MHNQCWTKFEGINEFAIEGKLGRNHLNFSEESRYYELIEICMYIRQDITSLIEGASQWSENTQEIELDILEILLEPLKTKRIKDVNYIEVANRVLSLYCILGPQFGESFKKRFNFDNSIAIKAIKHVFLTNVNTHIWSKLDMLHILRNLAAFSLPYQLLMAAAENFFYGASNSQIKNVSIDAINSCGWSSHILNERVPSKQYSSEIEFWGKQFSCGYGMYAFGHMLNAYEALLSLCLIAPKPNCEVVLSPSMVANSALALMISKTAIASNAISLRIGESEYVKWRYTHSKNQNFCELSSTLFRLRLLRARNSSLVDYVKPVMQTQEADWNELAMLTMTRLYQHPRPYVTLYMRDAYFKNEVEVVGLNSDRNGDPSRMREIALFIISKGYDVLRIGDKGMSSLEIDDEGYFEYCRSPVKSDLNDLYVASKAEFCVVGGLGGAATLGDVFGKNSIYVDFPLVRRGFFNPLASIIPYNYYINKLLMSPEQLFSLTPGGCYNTAALSERDIHWQPQSINYIKEKLEKFMVYLSEGDSKKDTRLICRKVMGDSTILNPDVSNKADMFPIYVL